MRVSEKWLREYHAGSVVNYSRGATMDREKLTDYLAIHWPGLLSLAVCLTTIVIMACLSYRP